MNYIIVGLLMVNISLTAYAVFGDRTDSGLSTTRAQDTDAEDSILEIQDAQAIQLANRVVALYNAKDDAGLYGSFDPLAKTQLTQDQLSEQLRRIYQLMGSVSDVAFSNAKLAGEEGGRKYYQLNYKVRLTGGSFSNGDMRLTVTRRDDGLGIVGFFINGLSQTPTGGG